MRGSVGCSARTCLESFPVEANTSVWMLKSEALKQYRAQAHEALGEDDVVLCRQAATGGPGEAYHDNVLVTQAGITDQQVSCHPGAVAGSCTPSLLSVPARPLDRRMCLCAVLLRQSVTACVVSLQELWLQRRAAAPSSSSSVLRLTMTVYGKDGMAAAQVPIEMPRAALLVELVVHASERGAATIREHAAAIGADASEAPQLVVWRDLAFGGKKALNVDQDALRTLEDLGFEEGEHAAPTRGGHARRATRQAALKSCVTYAQGGKKRLHALKLILGGGGMLPRLSPPFAPHPSA